MLSNGVFCLAERKIKTMKKEKFYQDLITGKFTSMVKETVKGQTLSSSKEVFNIIKPLTEQEQDVEQFWALFLDAKNNILKISMMFKGSLTAAAVYPRELIKKVLSTKAAAVICCHNHPSGNPEPSSQDHELTLQLLIALKSIGVCFHEHLIVGNGAYYSMADHGIMGRLNDKYNILIRG